MDNYEKYTEYKLKYTELKIKDIMNGGKSTNHKLVYISGIPGSGKSTVAKDFEKKGYYLISTDIIIENNIIPLFTKEIKHKFNGKKTVLYGIYHPKNYGRIIEKARNIFVKKVKNIIEKQHNKGKKVVIEGTILNEKVLRGILGDNKNFKLYLIKPKNKKIYTERFIKRFTEDPENYGRLGILRKLDKDGIALKDYKKNGVNGKIISKLIKKVVDIEYCKMKEWVYYYTKWGLDIDYIIN